MNREHIYKLNSCIIRLKRECNSNTTGTTENFLHYCKFWDIIRDIKHTTKLLDFVNDSDRSRTDIILVLEKHMILLEKVIDDNYSPIIIDVCDIFNDIVMELKDIETIL